MLYRTQLDVGVAVIVIDWTDDFAIHWRSIGNWELGVDRSTQNHQIKIIPEKKEAEKIRGFIERTHIFFVFSPNVFFSTEKRGKFHGSQLQYVLCTVYSQQSAVSWNTDDVQ